MPGSNSTAIADIIGQAMRILVVDDDPIQGLYTSAFLDNAKTKVDVAGSGAEALHKVAQNRYDFILLDYDMPGMNGIDFLNAVRRSGENLKCPVMLVTSHRDAAIANTAYDAGVCHVFYKPVDWRLLAQMIKYYVTKTTVTPSE
ncbi:MAG: response regulator [Beijerinckiaceae bacterium]